MLCFFLWRGMWRHKVMPTMCHFGAEPLKLLKIIFLSSRRWETSPCLTIVENTQQIPLLLLRVRLSEMLVVTNSWRQLGEAACSRVCGWAVGVCWHITLLPMFLGCETGGGGDLLPHLLCVTLVCIGIHPTPCLQLLYRVNTTQLFICLLQRERFTRFGSFLVSPLMQSILFF